MDELVAAASAEFGRVDILVNNAGVMYRAPFVESDEATWRAELEVNVFGVLRVTRAVLPGMIERGRGHVVSMSSLAAKAGASSTAPYAATKAALIGLTRSLRQEHRSTGVGFSVVCPGFVAGDGMYAQMVDAGMGDAPALVGTSPIPKVVDAVVESIERDAPERIVNHRRPLRPVLALGEIAPALAERIARVGGVNEYFERVARGRGRGG